MVRKERGEFVAECNECGQCTYGNTGDDFVTFIQDIKSDGWRVRKLDDEWVHVCSECSQ